MNDNSKAYKKDLGYNWVKAESGNTYLCPIGSMEGGKKKSEKYLRQHCIDESANPQNN